MTASSARYHKSIGSSPLLLPLVQLLPFLPTFVILIPVNIICCYSKESDLNKRDSNKSDDDSEECCCSPSYLFHTRKH